ncbi:alkene reductase [Glaciecola sp. MH2013]|uniref:alkene reductase n=1 Tax=Glaciecola sp. MH2013 TaxID=2785524 RepID=UPI0018A03553|nr:alkene reductase [Glaciecola sp. MH2013]MBF7072268.1 alkene reductase [Glaciecola sp. MH2013]
MTATNLYSTTPLFNKTLKNRFVLAPLTRGRAGSERVPNQIMGDYYEQRASAGLIITEATHISKEAIGWIDSPGIYNNKQVAGWKAVVDRVHAAQSTIMLQLWHMGRASHSDFHDGDLPLSASAIKIEGDQIHTPYGKKDFEVPREMSIDDIKRTVADYKKAAENAKDAGFDGVEIHAANGYLINQFLDGESNKRTDEYGGSIDNRLRFLKEIVSAIKEVFDAANIGVRISPNGVYNSMGCDDYRELFSELTRYLESEKIGVLHVMDGLAFGFHERGEPMTLGDFRSLFSGKIIGNCGYTFESATSAVATKQADMIAFGRPYITNPDLPQRYKNDWPLTPFDDMSHWYGGGAEGYSDYPAFDNNH